MQNLSAEIIIEKLGMLPHPEGGFFAVRPFVQAPSIAKNALPLKYSGDRESASIIYYLLKKGDISAWHQLKSSEAWFWHCGGSLEMALAGTEETPNLEQIKTVKLGANLVNGEEFSLVAPADYWQTTRLVSGDFALVSCVVSPAFSEDDCILPQMEQYFK